MTKSVCRWANEDEGNNQRDCQFIIELPVSLDNTHDLCRRSARAAGI